MFPLNARWEMRAIFKRLTCDTMHLRYNLTQLTWKVTLIWWPIAIMNEVWDWTRQAEMHSISGLQSKLCIPSTLNIDLILWYIQLIVCAENVKSLFKSWVFPFTFQAYILPHTLNCMCVSLFKFHIWILEQF